MRNNGGLRIITHRTSLFEISPYIKMFNHTSNNIENLPLTRSERKFQKTKFRFEERIRSSKFVLRDKILSLKCSKKTIF